MYRIVSIEILVLHSVKKLIIENRVTIYFLTMECLQATSGQGQGSVLIFLTGILRSYVGQRILWGHHDSRHCLYPDVQIREYLGILVTRKFPKYVLHFVKIGRIFVEVPPYLAKIFMELFRFDNFRP